MEVAPDLMMARLATDDFDERRGLLTASCSSWSYDELEHWTRYVAQSADLAVLQQWLVETRRDQGYQVTFDGQPTREELLSVILPLIQISAKRHLCRLLLLSNFNVGVKGRAPFEWQGTRLLPRYLPAAVVDEFLAETRPDMLRMWGPYTTLGKILLNINARTGSTSTTMARTIPLTVLPDVPQRTDIPEGQIVALAGLSGSCLASLLSRDPEPLPPLRVLLEVGNLFLIDRATRPSYDSLVIRAHGGEARVTVIVLSRR